MAIRKSLPRILVAMRAGSHRWRFLSAVLVLLLVVCCAASARAGEKPGKPLVIYLEPFGIPKALFGRGGPLLCLHMHPVGTRLFWLDATHLFAAFTTGAPCTFHSSQEPATLRGIVFDTTTGVKIASRDWPITEDLSVFPGPDHTIVLKSGSKLEFMNAHLQETESGELDSRPKGLWFTPRRQTIPLLTADGRNYEFYAANPLRLIDTISLDATDEVRAIQDWVTGDERIAGSSCADKSEFSCTKIVVQTPDAKFIEPDGAPWSYSEKDKPVSLQPVGFLDATHLIITRQDKGFFHGPQMLIVTPTGARIELPALGSFYPRRIAGIAQSGRFAMEMYALGNCANCIIADYFVVIEPDDRKFFFEKRATPYVSAGEMSPDGKWMAILDESQITFYPLPDPH